MTDGVSTKELERLLDRVSERTGLSFKDQTLLFCVAREALANRKASAWQGFDFAPKDSRQILAWWKKDVWGVVYWSETEGNWLENDQIVGEAKFFRELDAPPRSLPSDGDGK